MGRQALGALTDWDRKVGPRRLEFLRVEIVLPEYRKEVLDDSPAEFRILEWENKLDTPYEVSRHPVGAAEENQRLLAMVFEIHIAEVTIMVVQIQMSILEKNAFDLLSRINEKITIKD